MPLGDVQAEVDQCNTDHRNDQPQRGVYQVLDQAPQDFCQVESRSRPFTGEQGQQRKMLRRPNWGLFVENFRRESFLRDEAEGRVNRWYETIEDVFSRPTGSGS